MSENTPNNQSQGASAVGGTYDPGPSAQDASLPAQR